MNLDYVIPSNPAVCRRLKQASEVIEMTLDPKIIEMAEQGLIDPQHIRDTVQMGFLDYTPELQNFCQYAADHNYRVLVLGNNPQSLMRSMLASVMVSSERILITTTANTSSLWLTLIRLAGLKSWAMYDEKSDHANDHIVVAKPDQMTDGFINNNRDRVVLRVVPSGARGNPQSYWTKENHPDVMLTMDFPKIITGCDIGGEHVKWWDNYNTVSVLEELHTDVNWSRVFGYKNSDLTDMKFKTVDPDAIGHLYGVYTGFLKP